MKNILKAIVIFSVIFSACTKDSQLATSDKQQQGVSGSLTRFTLKDNYMYALDVNYMKVFDITNGSQPVLMSATKVNYGLETITIYGDNIYIGAFDRVYILNIKDPSHPTELQEVVHHISCDPVVVQGNYAYSTQNSSEIGCGHATTKSILAIYNAGNPQQTTLVKSIEMTSPYGLAVEGNYLYVCDSEDGVVIFDISNPANPVFYNVLPVVNPRDIILKNPFMIVSTQTSFEMYNYANAANIYHVSTLQLK